MEQEKKASRPAGTDRLWGEHGEASGLFLLFALLVGVLFILFTPDREASASENRKLAQRPAFTLSALVDGSYFAAWEDYIADQFPGRDGWITLDFRSSRLMGARQAGGVYLCRNNYLMEPPAAPDEESLGKNLQAVNAFAARHGDLRISMSIVPNAACVLEKKLPKNAPVRDQKKDLQAIAGQLQGVAFLDVTEGLSRHAEEKIFYRTDHHWTSLGAYYAFLEMAPGLGLENYNTEFDVFPVSNNFEGTLASRSGCHAVADVIELYIPKTDTQYYVTVDSQRKATMYDKEKLKERDQYAVFLGGNAPRVDVTTTGETGKSLLLFRDSYSNCFLQFLLPCYDKIVLLDPRYYYGDADSVVSQEGITDVLFLYNANTFLEDKVLSEVLTPPES